MWRAASLDALAVHEGEWSLAGGSDALLGLLVEGEAFWASGGLADSLHVSVLKLGALSDEALSLDHDGSAWAGSSNASGWGHLEVWLADGGLAGSVNELLVLLADNLDAASVLELVLSWAADSDTLVLGQFEVLRASFDDALTVDCLGVLWTWGDADVSLSLEALLALGGLDALSVLESEPFWAALANALVGNRAELVVLSAGLDDAGVIELDGAGWALLDDALSIDELVSVLALFGDAGSVDLGVSDWALLDCEAGGSSSDVSLWALLSDAGSVDELGVGALALNLVASVSLLLETFWAVSLEAVLAFQNVGLWA